MKATDVMKELRALFLPQFKKKKKYRQLSRDTFTARSIISTVFTLPTDNRSSMREHLRGTAVLHLLRTQPPPASSAWISWGRIHKSTTRMMGLHTSPITTHDKKGNPRHGESTPNLTDLAIFSPLYVNQNRRILTWTMTEGNDLRSFPRNGSRASDVSFARYPRADLVAAGGPGTYCRTLVHQGEMQSSWGLYMGMLRFFLLYLEKLNVLLHFHKVLTLIMR